MKKFTSKTRIINAFIFSKYIFLWLFISYTFLFHVFWLFVKTHHQQTNSSHSRETICWVEFPNYNVMTALPLYRWLWTWHGGAGRVFWMFEAKFQTKFGFWKFKLKSGKKNSWKKACPFIFKSTKNG